MLPISDALPPSWTRHLRGGRISIGFDVGTTTKATSNPSVLALMQEHDRHQHVRLMLSWKSSDDEASRRLVRLAIDQASAAGHRPRRLVIDASNEVYFATGLRRSLAGIVPVHLVKSGQKLKFRGEEMDAKTLLGNLYSAAMEDGFVLLPEATWIADDHRLVMREAGGFQNLLGKNGRHGDTFDACKLAYWGQQGGGGTVAAAGASTGGKHGTSQADRPGIRNPYAKAHTSHSPRITA
jgi:hypothetical protein